MKRALAVDSQVERDSKTQTSLDSISRSCLPVPAWKGWKRQPALHSQYFILLVNNNSMYASCEPLKLFYICLDKRGQETQRTSQCFVANRHLESFGIAQKGRSYESPQFFLFNTSVRDYSPSLLTAPRVPWFKRLVIAENPSQAEILMPTS